MRPARRRILLEGLGYGVAAGMIFAVAEMTTTALLLGSARDTLRLFASVVVGEEALASAGIGVLAIGAAVHIVLSALFGVIYAAIVALIAGRQVGTYGAQAPLGVLYGLSLWLINFHVIARIVYPWFLETNQVLQSIIHALFYGMPLGLLIAAEEKRGTRAARERAA